ncbi:hypothetical protein IQ07DRAFT_584309 [Pyrenochaeta sp. DS3sAY3a]|nr:hypothetical protein IQ07DRAFT_584309 [Pyrenochaeta sp. DS3sAY3a]
MRIHIFLSLFLSSLNHALAHYSFARFLINDTITADWQYWRKITDRQTSWPFYFYDRLNKDIRCNQLVNTSWTDVETLKIAAGTTLGIGIVDWVWGGRVISEFKYIWHTGPAQVYLSRAPKGDIGTYQGDGEWFKIGEYGWKDEKHWILDGCDETGKSYAHCTFWMNYTIPLTIPPGKYLLRAEHLFNDYSGVNNTQFYHSCAHIDVVGPGGGVPGPTIRLPEGYVDDPGTDFTEEQAYYTWGEKNLTGYRNAGPTVWKG